MMITSVTVSASSPSRRLQPQDLNIKATYDANRFTAQAQVARDTAAIISELGDKLTPEMLKGMLTNNLMMFPEIYGSCIAFEPNSFPLVNGTLDRSRPDLVDGVPIASHLFDGKSARSAADGHAWTLGMTEISTGVDAVLYAPYAHKDVHSHDLPYVYLDIAGSYNYFTNSSDWYHSPRQKFLTGSMEPLSGFWSEPYFDDNAGNISMVTFSVPFWRRALVPGAFAATRSLRYGWPQQRAVVGRDGETRYLWGIATIDIALGSVRFSCNASEVWDRAKSQCRNCSAGSYKAEENSCRSCGRGTYTGAAGFSECLRCGFGKYQTALGKSTCSSCEDLIVGSTTQFLGASRELDCACPPGSHEASGSNDTRYCVACPVGTYADRAGLFQCIACPHGMVSSTGSSQCGCPVGSEDHGDSCELCPVGFYKNTLRGKCLRCPKDARSDKHLITDAEGATDSSFCKLPVLEEQPYMICILTYCLRPEMLVIVSSTFLAVVVLVAYVMYLRMRVDALWVVSPSELTFGDPVEVLGRGSFGFVVRAEYRGESVAVKRVIPPSMRSSNNTSSRIFGHGDVGDHCAHAASSSTSGHAMTPMGRVPSNGSQRSQLFVDLERGRPRADGLDGRTSGALRLPSRAIDNKTPHSINPHSTSHKIGQKFSETGRMCERTPCSTFSAVRCGVPCGMSTDPNRRLKRDFIREMRVLSKLRHRCVTTVMGAVISNRNDPMLIMELMEHGSLHDLLHNETMLLEGSLVLPILQDVAKGLRFLHAANPVIIHGDLKSANVLVDAKFSAKVADFGLSQKAKVGACGTPFWMAPEVLHGGSLTRESDVYAFGILLSEVFCGDPYQGIDLDHDEVLIAVRDSRRQLRPDIPSSCCADVAVLMRDCWRHAPELRPSFGELDRRLKSLDAAHADAQPRVGATSLQASKEARAKRTDELLYDVFPKHVADALREGLKVEPESKDTVTIFFSDIVGFTEISSQLEPHKVSLMLDRLYSKFDELSREFKVFKVETIGDAYMAVTNLVEDQRSDHAKRIAMFALRAIETANQTPIDEDDLSRGYVNIRVGFHTGHVVANVVGTRNLRYCLFGDTVNTASRMESNSKVNSILCSKQSAGFLRQQAPELMVTSRGIINVKGKGEMETFWVSARP